MMNSYTGAVITARERILVPALDEWEELADIDWCVRQDNPGQPLSVIQQKTIDMIRSLVGEGLCELGTVEQGQGFVPVSDFEEGLSKLSALYIDHHDDRRWRYAYWLNLTQTGERLARRLYAENPEAYAEED